MVEPAGSIAGILNTVVEVAAPIGRQFMYLYNSESNIDDLEEEIRKLKNAEVEVNRKVEAADKNLEEVKPNVKEWQSKVKNIFDEADELIRKKPNNLEKEVARDEVKHDNVNRDEAEKAYSRCLIMRFSPNLITRYKNGKEASRKVKTIGKLLEEEKTLVEVSHATRLEDVRLASEKGYEDFDSRNFTLVRVLEALKDANVNMVGVSGMGGIGKSTLVKAVGRQVKNEKLFDEVVFVEVTDTPDIKKIQDEIANQLDLKFTNKSEFERANKIHARLKKKDKESETKKKKDKESDMKKEEENDKKENKEMVEKIKKEEENDKKENKEMDEKCKKILVILDNVWEDRILEKIGIPSAADLGESKVLLTARERTVLEKMVCRIIPIDRLEDKEAWKLFKKMAGDSIENCELKSLAEEVCKKCGGLPIAIVTVAKALNNRSDPSEWREALQQFQRSSPENFEGDLEQAYLSIELSYNYLKGEQLKKTFLLCSLMEHEASILDLLKYVMGLNILEGICTMQKARDRVYTFIRKLKDSCLLLDGQTSESFSMHDFVREVAISIANRDNSLFYVRNDTDQWEWPHEDRLKICTNIFIRDSDIRELPEGLKCPQLESFFMNSKVSNSRFQIPSMPPSRWKHTNLGDSQVEIPKNFFIEMTKLKVLDLTRIRLLSLQSSLHLLKDLQTLCLNSCKFEDVAIIGELKCLKILSLRGSNVEQFPREIAQLTKLRLLDLSYCKHLKVIAPNVIPSLFRLEELYMSGCSVQWEVEGHNVEGSTNASLEELKHLSHLTTLELDIEDDKILPQGLFSKELRRYKISIGDGASAFGGVFIFGDHPRPMRIMNFSLEEQRTFRTLRTLKLKHNSIICLEELQAFKNVEFLCLDKLQGVQNVLYELDKEGFSQLKHLRVHNNPNLLRIVDSTRCIPHDAFPAFPLMESLILCNLIQLENICCGQPIIKSFCNLKFIEVQNCGKLTNIFSFSNIAGSLPQLQRINVNDCPNMKEIFAIECEDNVSNFNEVTDHEINLCQLQFLTLNNLPRLASFFSEVMTPSTLQPRQMESTINCLSNDINLEDELDNFTSLFDEQVVFQNLEVLDLKGLKVEKIWNSQLQTSLSYQNLTQLTLKDCEKLKYVFPSSILLGFKKLQHLEIWNCKVLKEIVSEGETAEEDARFVKAEWSMLKKLKLWNCDKLQIYTLEYKVVFPNLEVLDLKKLNIEKIWDSQLHESMSSSCQNLTRLTIQGCEKLKYLFPSFMVESFKQLQHLEITNCKVLEEIVAKGGGAKAIATFKFLEVTFLKLQDLPELRAFYPGMHTSEWPMLKNLEVYKCDKLQIFTSEHKVVFSNLEALILDRVNTKKICWNNQLHTSTSSSCRNLTRLIVKGCEKLKNLLPSSMVESFKQLQHLEICNCKVLEEIVAKGAETTAMIKFAKVTFLKLQDLPELTAFYPGIHTSEWPILKNLEVYRCNKLQVFTSEYKVVSPNLDCLKLDGIDLEKIFDNQFEQLQHLKIWNCKVLKEIVVKAAAKLFFPRVTFLSLQGLSELTILHISEWPMLKKLEVLDCAKVEIFSKNNEGQPDILKHQSPFLHEKLNHNLEELILGGKSIMMIWRGLFPENLFCRLKVLQIQDDKSANIPLGILQRFNSLEKLRLKNSSYKEMFSCGEEKKHTGILAQMKSLELDGLFYMKYWWKQDSNLNSLLQNLEFLEVYDCEILINVVPPLASFQNLTVLKVEACNRLMNVITSSTAKSLGQLREMKIGECEMLIEIVKNGGDAAKEVIDFTKLKKLSLEDLESLTCFCFGNYTFNFPSLEELIVDNCPKMKTFFEGDLSTPTLQKVKESPYSWDEGCWGGDLNTTIQQLHKKWVNSNLEELTLSGRDITPMWQGQLPENFCELKVLEVIKDESANIPIGILQRFNNLEQLILKGSSYNEMFSCGDDVKNVGMLTHIKILKLSGLFNLKNMWKQDPQLSILQNLETLKVQCCHSMINLLPSSASFGNLITLKVQCCDGLINMLTSSMAKTLVQLEKMKVRHCEIMTEIVANEGDEEKGEIVFNKLESMSLEELASLTRFGFGNYTIQFPALEELIVVKCPKMETFFGGILSTPSLQYVQTDSYDDDEGCWKGDLNTTLQYLHKNEY